MRPSPDVCLYCGKHRGETDVGKSGGLRWRRLLVTPTLGVGYRIYAHKKCVQELRDAASKVSESLNKSINSRISLAIIQILQKKQLLP